MSIDHEHRRPPKPGSTWWIPRSSSMSGHSGHQNPWWDPAGHRAIPDSTSTCSKRSPPYFQEKSERNTRSSGGLVARCRFYNPGRPGSGWHAENMETSCVNRAQRTGWMMCWPRFREYARDLGYIALVTTDLTDRRLPGRPERADRRTLQEHHQGDRRRSKGRVWEHRHRLTAELRRACSGDAEEPITCRPADLITTN